MKNKHPIIRIVDDDPAIHDSLSLIFDMADFEIRHYYSAESFLTTDLLSEPGCAIVDLRMGNMSGLELQETLNERDIDIPLIFLSGHGDIETAVNAMQKGAKTFLTKPVSVPKLMQAIESIVNNSETTELALKNLQSAILKLSAREREIANLLRNDLNCRTIADRLGLSIRTVENHRLSIARKLSCEDSKNLSKLLKTLSF